MLSKRAVGAGSTGAGFFGAGAVPAVAFRAVQTARVATDLAMIELSRLSFIMLVEFSLLVLRLPPAGRQTDNELVSRVRARITPRLIFLLNGY